MTRKPAPKPKAKPSRAAKPKAKPPAVAKAKTAPRPSPAPVAAPARQAGGYVFQIGPVKTKPGDRLKGASKAARDAS